VAPAHNVSLSTMNHFRRIGCVIRKPLAIAALAFFIGTGAGPGSPAFDVLGEWMEAAAAAAETEAAREGAETAACALG